MAMHSKWESDAYTNAVAVIGMAGRFSQAEDLDQLWRNLLDGVEVVRSLDTEALRVAGCPARLRNHPCFVPMSAQMGGVDFFDAGFFGYTPAEARSMDPQLRLMLEASWHAFEDAGVVPGPDCGLAGVFAGAQFSLYWPCNVRPDYFANQCLAYLQPALFNGQDFLSTWISYKLGLCGPSVNVQTACSTGLVAVATACQNLLDHSCDLALAVAASVSSPRGWGYLAEPESILSPTGHCRPFDARASGTISGEGAGAVLLKRLGDAIADGDAIHAVIRGCAVNNDGAARPGYSSPSVQGQRAVIRMAQSAAGVRSGEVQLVEAHGTGTILGDPIEFAALDAVFRNDARTAPCILGSAKANYGHLGAAAGMLALLKVILCLEHETFVPQINYDEPNPGMSLEGSAFRILRERAEWESGGPRIAALSSFGFGGTNCHAVLEQWPREPDGFESGKDSGIHSLYLSAASRDGLAALCARWAEHLESRPEHPLRGLSVQSLRTRKALPWRAGAWGRNSEELVQSLRRAAASPPMRPAETGTRSLVAVFSGQGAQAPGMVRALCNSDETFRASLERSARLVERHAGTDLVGRALSPETTPEELSRTDLAQPVLLSIGCALHDMLRQRGARPDAFMGHSLGEYTAACAAGVFSLEDAVRLVCARGRLMAALPGGSMMAVAAPPEALLPWLEAVQSVPGQPAPVIAAHNSPEQTVVSGTPEAVAALAGQLSGQGLRCTRLAVSHAFHSPLMEPMIEAFLDELRRTTFHEPALPVISNMTGKAETTLLCTPEYWRSHTLRPVLFRQGLLYAVENGAAAFIEIGPRPVLAAPAAQTLTAQAGAWSWTPLLDAARVQGGDEGQAAAQGLIELHVQGVALNPADASARRLRLPLYPFTRDSHWLDMPVPAEATLESIPAANPEAPAWPGADDDSGEPQLLDKLAAIWGSVLGLEELGEDDNFFALGGTSIAAIRILTAIRTTTGATVSLSEFSTANTLNALERLVDARLREQSAPAGAAAS
ncbi:Acyl transferase domain-containing protein [Humidesulfovibrio mexicanus]|uniref:Acyl transferase domain-containing protein n=1 Tax=Humidesulfovibrio mexicanus TaxID=147047 RepID=A0A239BJP9_9BACT|nr:type I polyketide synthase [Humidesulfovibrio mexicanus]SNS08375.1 Acyl transferase domain-containing protein [Humidesulfovibrio mexicanus]